jgi:hypothetical protein
LGRLCIAFRNGDRWSTPQDLGEAVNKHAPWGSHLGPDHRTPYFTGVTHGWQVSLTPWISSGKHD